MDIERFGKSTSGKLVKIGRGEDAYWAFVPNPLPPKLEFDAELVSVLSDADRALGELSGLGRTAPNPNLFIGPFIRREAVLSSRIEGTQADIADLYAYEAGQLSRSGSKPAPPESDVREVLNYVHALEYGIERIHELPVSLRLLRELHERLMEGIRGDRYTPGEFRRSQNWIGPPGCPLMHATYVPPPVPEMQTALGAFEKYLHAEDGYPPLVRIALIHQHFEALHPFLDGNGRIGRLLISLLLVHWNLLPMPLLYLSAYFERNRQEYYERLLAVSQEGDWHGWLLYFLQGVAEQSVDVIDRAKRLQELQAAWRAQLQQTRAPGLLLSMMDSLFRWPYLSGRGVQADFGVSHPTAMQALRKLQSLSIVQEVTEGGRNRMYVSDDIVRILEQ